MLKFLNSQNQDVMNFMIRNQGNNLIINSFFDILYSIPDVIENKFMLKLKKNFLYNSRKL